MDADTVALLGTPTGVEALLLATAHPDPSSLSAAQTLRTRYSPDLAAAALTQAELRRRGVAKFGDQAQSMFFTRDGLEQATRPAQIVQQMTVNVKEIGIITEMRNDVLAPDFGQ